MATQTITKKRKSIGDATTAVKKVKTAKSEEKPAPLKSALKKTKDQVVEAKVKPTKAAKEKKAKKVEDDVAVEDAAVETAVVAKVKPGKAVKAKKTEKADGNDEVEETALAKVVDDADEGGVELTEDQTAALLAGFSSSEDEASGDEDDGIPANKLPQAPRTKEVQKAIKKATADDPERTPGVVYIGRIPHGFYEHQLRAYFSQFGEIEHLRLARNRKTGKSQHYGFIEFASKAVAEIVAKTMDKYLLFDHILQCRTLPREQVKESMWKGSDRRKKPAPRNRLEGSKLKRGMVREDWDKKVQQETQKRAAKAEKLKELGYDFEMPALKSVSQVPARPKEIEATAGAEQHEIDVKLVEEVPEAPEVTSEVTKTVQKEGNGVTVTETKKTKKRPSAEAKTKKAKKAKT